MLNQETTKAYAEILKEELVPAMGCTEPIAVAYAGALARRTLGALPERVELTVSGNIIKNVKSVIVPHTGGRKGLQTAVAVGICCGDAEKELEVLSDVTEGQMEAMDAFLKSAQIVVLESDADCPFDIRVRVCKGGDSAYIRIIGNHTNVVNIRRNEEVLLDKPFCNDVILAAENRKLLNVRDIVAFADEADLEDVREVLKRQIEYNTAIAEAGMSGRYGASIGKILIRSYGNSVQNRAKAYAAAGSDARMNGCELPVVINSGSGNQGSTYSPGHDGLHPCDCLRKRVQCVTGHALPRPDCLQPCDDSPEDGNRQPVRLLRGHQRRGGSGGRHLLSVRRALR